MVTAMCSYRGISPKNMKKKLNLPNLCLKIIGLFPMLITVCISKRTSGFGKMKIPDVGSIKLILNLYYIESADTRRGGSYKSLYMNWEF